MNHIVNRPACLLLGAVLLACAGSDRGRGAPRDPAEKFRLSAVEFEAGGMMPRTFTCDGADVSPALTWTDPPAGTESFALIMDDPDAPGGTWVHWVLYDLPASARGLPESVPPDSEVSGGGRHGESSFGKRGYGGPCPPHGPAHRYYFKLYALHAKTGLQPGATKADLEKAMKGLILAKAELVGHYHR